MYPNLLTLSFHADGSPADPARHRATLERLQTKSAGDVLFVTHGWMNDTPHAPQLFAFFASALPEVSVCGVQWPTQPFGPYGVIRPDREATAHYLLRERAVHVGCAGLGLVLAHLALSRPGLRVHLAGYSFGAWMMAEAAAHHAVQSITLIQPSMPADSFSPEGACRALVDNHLVRTPMVITHSRHDHALPGSLAQSGLPGAPDFHSKAAAAAPIVNLNGDHFIRTHTDLYHVELSQAIRSRCCPSDTAPRSQPCSPGLPATHSEVSPRELIPAGQ
jgi:pimeloyl-ACP methyl ester carboxylesterase